MSEAEYEVIILQWDEKSIEHILPEPDVGISGGTFVDFEGKCEVYSDGELDEDDFSAIAFDLIDEEMLGRGYVQEWYGILKQREGKRYIVEISGYGVLEE